MDSVCVANSTSTWSAPHQDAFVWVEFIIILLCTTLGQCLRSYGYSYSYALGGLVCMLAFSMRGFGLGSSVYGLEIGGGSGSGTTADASVALLYTLAPFVTRWVATIGTVCIVDRSGGFVFGERMMLRMFSKRRILIPTVAALTGVLCGLCVGTNSVAAFFVPSFLAVSKATGLRPSKAAAALIVGATLGAVCSPVNPAVAVMYARQLVQDATTGDVRTAEYVPYFTTFVVLFPSAIIGALAAGLASTFIGRDLDTSKTYQRRLAAGLVRSASHTSQEVVTDPALADRGMATPGSKLQREFSVQSRLTEGDYIYTSAVEREATLLEINDRKNDTANPPPEHSHTPAANYTGARYDGARYHLPYRTWKAVFALAAVVVAGICACVWGVLKSIPHDTDDASRNNFIHISIWPQPEYFYALAILTASLVVMLVNRIPGGALSESRLPAHIIPGVIGQFTYNALGLSFMTEWTKMILCIVSREEDKHHHSRIWWVLLASLIGAGDDGVPSQVIITANEFTPDLDGMRRWIASSIVMAASSLAMPTDANIIMTEDMDDTGSTRLGWCLFDHVFFVPALCGVAVAFGVAIGIACGMI